MATNTALAEAIDWHIALSDGASDRWHDFVGWLEADERNAEAYDRVVLDDALLGERRSEPKVIRMAPRPIVPARPAARARRFAVNSGWGGAAIAATIVGGVTLSTLVHKGAASPYAIEAPAGKSRLVTLDDGTRIMLNGGARVSLDHNAPRVATLDYGEAMFTVRHNAADPFRVQAAGRTIEDVGTRFDVVAQGNAMRVAVAEGSVAAHVGGDRIVLTPGMALRSDTPETAELSRIDPDAIGGWQDGHLDFDDMRLADVAEALHWSTGADVRVDPALADRRFSGVLRGDRGAGDAVRSLAALSGTRAARDGHGWILDKP